MDFELKKLMIDTANNCVINYTKEQANEAIRQRFNETLGLTADSNMKDIRKALRRHKAETYEIIEEVIDEKLKSGWGDNEFFKRFVDEKNLADGDKNEFYIPADTILTVTKFSGNHHDLKFCRARVA